MLMDATVEPEIYTNKEVSYIVRDIISKYVTTLTSNNSNANTGITLSRIVFNHTNVYEALKKLSDLSTNVFYVDVFKDLHFFQKESSSSGKILNNTNLKKAKWNQSREGIANRIWVYGDKYLTGMQEVFGCGSGIYLDKGSVFYTSYYPHDTKLVKNSTGYPLKGWVYQMGEDSPLGTQYLVDYYNKKLITLSGTSIGNFWLASGDSFTCTYNRDVPIVKMGENLVSENLYKPITKVIIDRNIKDPNIARDLLNLELNKGGQLPESGTLELKGFIDFIPGEMVNIDIPNFGINNLSYEVISLDFSFNKKNNLSENVLTVEINRKTKDIIDKIKSMSVALSNLQAAESVSTEMITRSIFSTGSIVVVGSRWNVYDRDINDSFVSGHVINGVIPIYNDKSIGSMIGSMISWSGTHPYLTGSAKSCVLFPFGGSSVNDGKRNHIEIQNSGSLWAGSNFSVMAWVYPFTGSLAANQTIFSKESNNCVEWTFCLGSTGSFALAESNVGTSFQYNRIIPNIKNTWQHIAITYSGWDYSYGYKDGVLIGSDGNSFQGIYPGSSLLRIGGNPLARNSGSSFFSGLICDVAYYNRCLSNNEIGDIYTNHCHKGGLLGYWKLIEGQGSTIYNSASIESPIDVYSNANTDYILNRFTTSGTIFSGIYPGSGMVLTYGDLGGGSCLDCGGSKFASGGTMDFKGWGMVSFWMKPYLNNSSGALFTAPARDLSTDDFNRMYIRTNQMNSLISYYVGDGSPSGYFYSNKSFSPYTDKWVHVAIVNDKVGSKSNLYINGSLDKSTNVSFSGLCWYSYNYNVAGGSPIVSWFSGLMDELRICDYSGVSLEPIDSNYIGSLYLGKATQPLSGTSFGDRRGDYILRASGGYY
jgi:hypothetical protein